MCPLDDAYDEYKQWKLDLGRTGCADSGSLVNVITADGLDFDPADYVGQVLRGWSASASGQHRELQCLDRLSARRRGLTLP